MLRSSSYGGALWAVAPPAGIETANDILCTIASNRQMNKTMAQPDPPACVFDAYGTLFDVGGAVVECGDVLGTKAGSLITCWREKQLQYTWLRSLQGQYSNFEQVTADALDYALEAHDIADPGLRDKLLARYFTLPAYPDAERALAQLHSAGIRALILSNGTPAMLERALAASNVARFINGVISVELAGVYKPHPRAYQLAVDALGISAERIVFVSSNGWDAHGAAAFGLCAIWCNRRRAPRERLPGGLAHQLQSLDELPPYLCGSSSTVAGIIQSSPAASRER